MCGIKRNKPLSQFTVVAKLGVCGEAILVVMHANVLVPQSVCVRERLLSRESYLESGLLSDFGSTNDIKHASFLDRIKKWWTSFRQFFVHGFEMGRSDPKKIIFAAKYGLAIAIVSAPLFFPEQLPYISSNNIIWAILTVVFVFELSVGFMKKAQGL
ncbi:Aluminum-activated malate transporter [Artemisia annua]|uniref:Aluminum-activated malate transporter n=1 Tax=Artemisia annua TaxID=35608 RepID=A0A2U1MFX3_ARTAN|nr:Aluminum-activated malate transporter [Artemisia annua]